MNKKNTLNEEVEKGSEFWCHVCAKDLQSSESLRTHQMGKKHLKKVQQQKVNDNDDSSLTAVQDRIVKLVRSKKHINASRLGEIYQDTYNEPLDHKRFGFVKLKNLVDTISSLDHFQDSTNSLIVSIKENNSKKKNSNSKVSVTSSNPREQKEEKMTKGSLAHSVSCPALHSFYEFATNAQQDKSTASDTIKNPTAPAPAGISPSSFLSSLMRTTSINMRGDDAIRSKKLCLGNRQASDAMEEMAFLGHTMSGENDDSATLSEVEEVYLNTHIPFCLAAIGVQGAGKSHTLGCILESCLLSDSTLQDSNVIRLHKPMTAMVLHYDQSTTSVCEAAGLLSPKNSSHNCNVAKSKAVILVSPTYYKQRKAFYGEYCHVHPLLFRWSSLTADHIKRVMRITAEDNQLYVASFMGLLRRYQRKAVVPKFEQFIEEVKEVCNIKGQSGPLDQRIALLESMIAESKVNEDIIGESMDLGEIMSSEKENKSLIIVDLTDPLLSKEEANCLFQVVTEQFRSTPTPAGGGKLLALDEAHKFMDGVKSDGLSEAIVNVARLMRHDGIRLAVSTQSPRALAPELLELVSVAVLHHFHSQNWWDYLCQKLPLRKEDFTQILQLAPGNALAFASRHNINTTNRQGTSKASSVINLWIRDRLTADFGASRTNRSE